MEAGGVGFGVLLGTESKKEKRNRSSVMAVASAKFLTDVRRSLSRRPACVDLLFDHMVVL